MPKLERVAVIKTGWSDDFQGAEVEGAHKHVRERGFGHEKYNFLKAPNDTYCIYVPPIREKFAPNPKEKQGWLVFHLAKHPKRNGLYLIGWYEDVEFLGGYESRPEYGRKGCALPLDNDGEQFGYMARSTNAVQLDPLATPHVFPGEYMKRAPVFYLRGGTKTEPWRTKLAAQLLAIRKSHGKAGSIRPKIVADAGGSGICADPERRKEVEQKAIDAVMAHYPENKFEVIDKQKAKCGFDLLVRPKAQPDDELHIEVKGTQLKQPHFLMSKNEYAHMLSHPDQWRLAVLTDALAPKPTLEIYTAKEAQATFRWDVFSWHGTLK